MPHAPSARPRPLLSLLSVLALGCAASTGATSEWVDPSAGAGGAPSSAGAANRAGASNLGGMPSSAGANSSAGSTTMAGTPTISAGASNAAGASSGGGAPGSTGTAGGKCNTAGPAGELFLDDFENGQFPTCPSWIDADPTLGGLWSVKKDGASQVLAQAGAVSDWVITVSGSYQWTDQVVSAKVKFTSSPGAIGIFARVQDVRNYYFLYLDGSNLVLRGRVDNSQLSSVKVKTATGEGTWYTLKLSVIGSTLTGYLDDMPLVTTTDSGVKGGGVGVGTSDDATGEFDDVTVTTP